jgi:type I restriction enzyme S subunit
VIPEGGVNNNYLAHLLRWSIDDLLRQSQGTTMFHITRRSLVAHPVMIPTAGEQHQIAEVLDSLDKQIEVTLALIAKLRQIRIASVRQLAAGGTWQLVPLSSLLAGIDAGNSPNLEDIPAGPGQWGVLKVSAVGEDGFRPEENKVVEDHGLRNPALCVRPGDLLMTRANTSRLVGLACVVDKAPDGLMLCDKTLRLRVDKRVVPTRYVQIMLGLADVRRQIENAATGTSGSMKNISQQAIRKLMIPLGGQEDVAQVVQIYSLHEEGESVLHQQVERLRMLKQGLMEDLLSGRVRVSRLPGGACSLCGAGGLTLLGPGGLAGLLRGLR